jgi:hypothetical protein
MKTGSHLCLQRYTGHYPRLILIEKLNCHFCDAEMICIAVDRPDLGLKYFGLMLRLDGGQKHLDDAAAVG